MLRVDDNESWTAFYVQPRERIEFGCEITFPIKPLQIGLKTLKQDLTSSFRIYIPPQSIDEELGTSKLKLLLDQRSFPLKFLANVGNRLTNMIQVHAVLFSQHPKHVCFAKVVKRQKMQVLVVEFDYWSKPLRSPLYSIGPPQHP